jgi:acyl-CoA thioester hydrolase
MTASLVCLSGRVRHLYACQVRWADLHGDGTVGNVFHVDYLQEARLDLLRHHDTSPTPNPGEGLVVVRTVVEYLQPIRYDDAPLTVGTWVSDLRAASFTLGYELSTSAGVHARATTRLAAYVFASERPRRLTPEERARLETNRDDPPFEDVRTPAATWEVGTVHRRPIRVRFSDVDLLGHVNNVRYFDYVHEANLEVLMDVFQEARVSGTVETVVARSEMDHVAQMNLRPEAYDVWSRVSAVGQTSVTLDSEIHDPLDGDRLMARSRVVEVNVDPEGRPAPWHEKHHELFVSRIG